MVIRADGQIRTSGWTFHEKRPKKPRVVASAARFPSERSQVLAAIRRTSDRHADNRALRSAGLSRIDWTHLFQALIEAESAYNPVARSQKGAFGLGQLMPATARSLGVDRRDPAQNLEGAARYLLAQLSTFGDVRLALAAYNAGPHRVRHYRGIPPFAETRAYIHRIEQIRHRLSEPHSDAQPPGANG